jgi:hypothetical protein
MVEIASKAAKTTTEEIWRERAFEGEGADGSDGEVTGIGMGVGVAVQWV